jgi:hypothetical protein
MVAGPSTIILTPYPIVRVYTCVDALNSPPKEKLSFLSCQFSLSDPKKKEKKNVITTLASFLVCFASLALHVSFYFYLAITIFLKASPPSYFIYQKFITWQ